MIWIILFFFLFSKSCLATTSVNINSVPASITIGESFPVTFTINTNSTSPSFHYKIVGTGVTLVTVPDSGCSGLYDSCPEINIGESGVANATAYAKITVITGNINVYIKVAESTGHKTSESDPQTILSYVVPTPSPTPTSMPTYIPSNTPVPTNTPIPTPPTAPSTTPTSTPTTKPSSTPTPTPKISTPTPYPTVSPAPLETPFNEPLPTESLQLTPTSSVDTLGIQDIIQPSPTPTKKPEFKFPTQVLPGLFIGLGGLLLLSPILIAKFKK